tara:strand:+ start:1230 stop:1532 length:303 start_codon:yes stop_codon:yes gene_type:complete
MSDAAIEFEAAMTNEQVTSAEQRLSSDHGMARRLVLLTLSKSKDELIQAVSTGDIEATEVWMEQIEGFQDDLKSLTEMASAAHARLSIAMIEALEAMEAE